MSQPASSGLSVFVSYAHEDARFKEELEKHLKPLIRSGAIDVWADHQLNPGDEWDATIRDQLHAADIFLLLISSDFNASDYIMENELTAAMSRHQEGTGRVVPVIVRPCRWEGLEFAKLQALPPHGRPISQYDDPDEAYLDIATGIERLVTVLNAEAVGS